MNINNIELVKLDNVYDWREDESEGNLQFMFVSEGNSDIVKAVQYSLLSDPFLNKPIHNLGFGDYDIENDQIIDSVNSNNGDVYKVFNTVLNTIVVFFEKHPDDIVLARGSDSNLEFVDNCRLTCKKRCPRECKNFNRRINTYRSYVNRNYERLTTFFDFRGGIQDGGKTMVEPYQVGKNYDTVLVFRKIPIALTNES